MAGVDFEASDGSLSESMGIDPIVLSALLAIIAYLLQFIGASFVERAETRKEKQRLRNEHELTRIDYQLSSVFGPMRGLLLSSKAAFTMLIMRWQMQDDVPKFLESVCAPVGGDGPSDLQKDWMLWVEHILQPGNRQLCEVILQHSNGFDQVPSVLANVVANIKEFEVILAKWKAGDLTHMNTTIAFPDAINPFVEGEFQRLRKRKMAILEAMEVKHSLGAKDEDELDETVGLHLIGEAR